MHQAIRVEEKKNIIIIAYFYAPWNNVAVRRAESFVKAWSKKGHRITLITSSESFRVTRQDNDTVTYIHIPCVIRFLKRFYGRFTSQNRAIPRDLVQAMRSNSDSSHKVRVPRVKEYYANWIGKTGAILGGRMPSLTFFWGLGVFLWLFRSKIKPDIVIATSPPPIGLLVASIAKKLLFRPQVISVLDYRDAWTDDPLSKGVWPFTLVERYMETWCNRHANFIVRACESIEFYREQPSIHLPNGMDYSVCAVDHVRPSALPDTTLNLVYTGSVYDEQDWTPLFKALSRIEKESLFAKKIRVVLSGSVTYKFLKAIESYKIQGIFDLLGSVRYQESIHLQRWADICLFFPLVSRPKVSTGKVFEYLATAGEIWSIGVSDIVGPNALSQKTGVAKILGADVNLIKFEIETACKKKSEGLLQRPCALRYFSEVDREVLAYSLLKLVV